MDIEEEQRVRELMARVLMLETIQTSMCTFLAGHPAMSEDFIDKIFGDAENELRVMAIHHAGEGPDSARTADLALVYLAENARTMQSAMKRGEIDGGRPALQGRE